MIYNNNINNKDLSFLDIINLMSFCIAIANLNENLGQGDKQELLQTFSEKADVLLKEIHKHLETQDNKIDKILEVLLNDNRRDIQPNRSTDDNRINDSFSIS